MRKQITVVGCRSGADYLKRVLRQYFNKETQDLFQYLGELTYDFKTGEIENIELISDKKIDIFALNCLGYTESTCAVIKKVKEVNPQTKILFISTTVHTIGKEVSEAGADACFDCERTPVIGGGAQCGGATVAAIGWIFENFPKEPIEDTWSKRK